jgi:hypothetical protein
MQSTAAAHGQDDRLLIDPRGAELGGSQLMPPGNPIIFITAPFQLG